jgi:hypothetical protein
MLTTPELSSELGQSLVIDYFFLGEQLTDEQLGALAGPNVRWAGGRGPRVEVRHERPAGQATGR